MGAGRDATLIDARAARAFTFNRNAGIHAVEAGGTPDWCRSRLGQMSIRMTTGGVRAIGHELYAEGLRFSGGQPGGWCMELEDANECSLREISAGPGGGQDDLLASGIRLYATDANRNVNFGDSLLEEISIKLKGAGTTGILIEHQGTAVNGSFFVMNNLLLNRVQVNSAGAPAGSTGVWLKRVMRSALLNVDVEFVETAFRVEGAAASGNAGSCRHVSFVNCYVLNCAVPWVDSNAALPGSVMRCSFSNCHGFGLLNPVGIASNDANARAGEGDTFMPGAVWLTEPNAGQAAVQLRAPNPGQLLVTGEFYDGTSAVRDGNPKNKKPRQGLGIDITSFNVTRLYRPRGYATGEFSRLVVGNGEDFLPDGATAAPLHRVELADPVYLTPRLSEPPQALNGFVVYCETSSALPSGSPWTGPGWYARLGNRWQPGVQAAGRVADKERNAAFTVSPLDFGLVHRVNNSSSITVNVASTYDLGSGSTPLMQAGDPDAVLWLIRQGTGDVTIAAGDAGVEVKSPIAGATSLKIKRQYQLVTVILRFNATSGKIEVYGNTVPDGEFVYEEPLGLDQCQPGQQHRHLALRGGVEPGGAAPAHQQLGQPLAHRLRHLQHAGRRDGRPVPDLRHHQPDPDHGPAGRRPHAAPLERHHRHQPALLPGQRDRPRGHRPRHRRIEPRPEPGQLDLHRELDDPPPAGTDPTHEHLSHRQRDAPPGSTARRPLRPHLHQPRAALERQRAAGRRRASPGSLAGPGRSLTLPWRPAAR